MPLHAISIGGWALRTWALFGQVPVLLLLVMLFLAGRKRGWPWRSALLATAALAGGMSLGAAMLPSVLGAAAGGIGLWLLAQRLLGLRRAPYASLALALIVVIAVGRWGCLLNGCCFGRPTDLPWGIEYGAHSATWLLHRSLAVIAPDASAAIPVHPYPLYESFGLLLWLPGALWLRRRLRSEAALLLFSLAYDLALRGFLEGTRAMVNVWWALLGSAAGLNLFQWSLLAASAACLAAGLLVERRARARPVLPPALVAEPAPAACWVIFFGIWLVGWLTDASQTTFLHRILVGALAVSALGLRLPAGVPAPRWTAAVAAPALAAAMVLLLGVHVQRSAKATDLAHRTGTPLRGWLYEVDHRHEVIVRIGAAQESQAAVDQRRTALELPAADPAGAAPPADGGRTWLGGGVVGGTASYRVGNSCGNDYTLYDRKAGGGFLQAEYERSFSPTSVFWLGGRGSALYESRTKTVHTGEGGVGDVVNRYLLQTYAAQFWAEMEHPNVSFGAGGILGLAHVRTEGAGSTLDLKARPSFHVRLGASFLALDGGLYDRRSLLGLSAGHFGLSGALGRTGRIRHPDDTFVRSFLGAVVFPGADASERRVMLGAGVEVFATRRLVLGLQGGIGDGGFGVGYIRTVVGK